MGAAHCPGKIMGVAALKLFHIKNCECGERGREKKHSTRTGILKL